MATKIISGVITFFFNFVFFRCTNIELKKKKKENILKKNHQMITV